MITLLPYRSIPIILFLFLYVTLPAAVYKPDADSAIWIEERPSGQQLNNVSYDYLNRILNSFNASRTDNLRLYVVVVSDYEIQLTSSIDISKIRFRPGQRDLREAFKDLADANTLETVHQKLQAEMASIPKDISQQLQSRNMDARVVYFYGSLNFYDGAKKVQRLSVDHLFIDGSITQHRDKIREIAKAGRQDDGFRPVELSGSGLQIYDALQSIMRSVHLVVDKKNLLLPNMHATPESERGVWIFPDTATSANPTPGPSDKVLFENGSLYSIYNGQKIPYPGTPSGFLLQAFTTLKKISSTSSGSQLLQALKNSFYNVTIYHTSYYYETPGKSVFVPRDADAAYVISHYDQSIFNTQVLGSGGTLYWNPKARVIGIDFSPEAVLGHELFHAWDALRGYLDRRPSGIREHIHVSEYRAIYFENKIRNELGVGPNDIASDVELPPPAIHWL